MRLDKRLADLSGLSRRLAQYAIRDGRVAVDGVAEHDPARAVGDETIDLDGERLVPPPWFALFHKPVGVQSTVGDPWGRDHLGTVATDLLAMGLRPVGRLDADSSGLLPFCADGAVTQRLLHPRHAIEKVYVVTVEGVPGPDLPAILAAGVETSDGVHVATVRTLEGSRITLGIAEGKYRIVRRILANAGFPVTSLHRVAFGSLEIGDLAPGAWRIPDEREADWLVTLTRPVG